MQLFLLSLLLHRRPATGALGGWGASTERHQLLGSLVPEKGPNPGYTPPILEGVGREPTPSMTVTLQVWVLYQLPQRHVGTCQAGRSVHPILASQTLKLPGILQGNLTQGTGS